MIRLQKYLADAGIASRRASEILIKEGKIKVNHSIITELGTKIDPEIDIIEYNGEKILDKQKKVYYMLNKPVKYITTAKDEKGRNNVVDLLNIKERVFPVGRLDYMTSGLLILTNDGEITYKLTHPKHKIGKKYIVELEKKAKHEDVARLTKGVKLIEYETSPCEISKIENKDNKEIYEVTIYEGKNRQVRKMFEHIGNKVIFLQRIAIGELELKDLKYGEYRTLTEKEIKYLKKL